MTKPVLPVVNVFMASREGTAEKLAYTGFLDRAAERHGLTTDKMLDVAKSESRQALPDVAHPREGWTRPAVYFARLR